MASWTRAVMSWRQIKTWQPSQWRFFLLSGAAVAIVFQSQLQCWMVCRRNPQNHQHPRAPKSQKIQIVRGLAPNLGWFQWRMAKNRIKSSDANGCPWGHRFRQQKHPGVHVLGMWRSKQVGAAFSNFTCQGIAIERNSSGTASALFQLCHRSSRSLAGLPTSVWITPQAWMYSRPFKVCLASIPKAKNAKT